MDRLFAAAQGHIDDEPSAMTPPLAGVHEDRRLRPDLRRGNDARPWRRIVRGVGARVRNPCKAEGSAAEDACGDGGKGDVAGDPGCDGHVEFSCATEVLRDDLSLALRDGVVCRAIGR